MTLLLAAAVLSLPAAEQAPFRYRITGAEKAITGDAPVDKTASISAECAPQSKGLHLYVDVANAGDGALYRLIFQAKTAEPLKFFEREMHSGKEPWNTTSSTADGLRTFYMHAQKDAKYNTWSIAFSGRSKIEIIQLAVEKLTQEDLNTNLVYQDGLLPELWQKIWPKDGMGDKFLPSVLKREAASPCGTVLSFPAQVKGSGYPSLQAVPFIPDRDFEVTIWLRGSANGRFFMQVLNATGRESFGFKREWTEYRLKGKTGSKLKWCGPVFMIASFGPAIPAFDIGGITFRYLEK